MVLSAAEEVMSEKGLVESTISEIGRKAGVADSVIYQYFRGKEDLLFSIPGEKMKEVLTLLDEQLQGIPDAGSRLSKMAWFHLWYNDMHPGYARILLLECRSSPAFYNSTAYQLVRKYTRVLLDILKQGVESGLFRPDLEIRLMRDIIMGTLNEQTISCLAIQEIKESVSDLEDIISLINAMITRREENEVSKSDRILTAAEGVFAKKGFSKATVSEIANMAQVAEGTVYEYFENKEDLLLSIPAKRFEEYLNDLAGVFEIRNPEKKLKRFIQYHFSLFLVDREFLKVFLLQIQLDKRFYGTKAFKNFQAYIRIIEEIIEDGKSQGSFRSDVNARVFRNMFLGTFSHLALRWSQPERVKDFPLITHLNGRKDLLESSQISFSKVFFCYKPN